MPKLRQGPAPTAMPDARARTKAKAKGRVNAEASARAKARARAKAKATSARQHVDFRVVVLLRRPISVSSFGIKPKKYQIFRLNFMGPAKASQGQPRPAKVSQGRPGTARARASKGEPEQTLSRPFAVLQAS